MINGGIDERGGHAAIFGLHVVGGSADFYVRVVTKQHQSLSALTRVPEKPNSKRLFIALFSRII
jgi:hypothetical protein